MDEKTKKEEIEVAAYYISKANHSYYELCYLLAEKQLSSRSEAPLPQGDMSKEALKFFHSWILECISLGGANLPKSISTLLGAKLASVYKKRGIQGIVDGLTHSYEVLDAIPSIKKIDDETFEIKTDYNSPFCPIGGKYQPEKAELIRDCVCKPYTYGFLTAMDSHYRYNADVKECILDTNKNTCHYYLKLEPKK